MLKGLTAAVFAATLASVAAAGHAVAAEVGPTGAETPSSWQCAPFARMFSGIQLFGDAWTWWEQALGKYGRGWTPKTGSVLVFKPFGPMSRGHVAVVNSVLTDRIIQVTHANWSPVDGRRGQIENNVTIVDVSSGGDWSQVKVWYKPSEALGTTVYPTYGFVYRAAVGALEAATNATAGAFDTAARAALSAQIEQALR